jgi:hypothetical protein
VLYSRTLVANDFSSDPGDPRCGALASHGWPHQFADLKKASNVMNAIN